MDFLNRFVLKKALINKNIMHFKVSGLALCTNPDYERCRYHG